MKQRDLGERLLEFGAQIITLVEALPQTIIGRRVGGQLFRSGISVGAHYEEAQGAESAADFVHKLQIALKELRELNYWLRLVAKVRIVPESRLAPIIDEATQLRSILSKAVSTAKKKSKPTGSS